MDMMCWSGSSKEGFQVKSYYRALLPSADRYVPWKSIWKTKAPPRVAFFVWAAALVHILATDNLRRRHVIVLDWCCMCKKNGESISHLLLHCLAAREVWIFFSASLMSMGYAFWGLDLLACWGNGCRSARIRKLWDMIPLCVFWCIWWERNSRSFEGEERNLLEIKGMILRDWSNAFGVMSFSSVLDFLDYCIVIFLICTLPVYSVFFKQ